MNFTTKSIETSLEKCVSPKSHINLHRWSLIIIINDFIIIQQPAFGLVPVLLRPFSRGRISLKSRNPFRWPRMQPNFFSDQRDIETLTKGIRAVIFSLNIKLKFQYRKKHRIKLFLVTVFERSKYQSICEMENSISYETIFGM